jgi:hypothetical protein
LLAGAGELGADVVGVGMLYIIEDGERLLRGLPCAVRPAHGVTGVG